ncbi:unnamed protein product [Gadus morhua 'NCC']
MTTGAEQNGTRQVSPLLSHLWGLACVMMSRCVQVLLLLKANQRTLAVEWHVHPPQAVQEPRVAVELTSS